MAALRVMLRFARTANTGTRATGAGSIQPVGFKFEVNTRRFTRDLKHMDQTDLHRARLRALARIAALGRRGMQKLAPMGATARLKQGMHERILPHRLEARIVSKARHTRPVLHGSKPHWAPVKPLERWVRRKLRVPLKRVKSVTYAVRRKIARRGTRKQDFVTAPFRHMVRAAPRIIREELAKAPGVR